MSDVPNNQTAETQGPKPRNNDWRTFSPAYLRTRGIWPNRLRHNANTREGMLAVQQHKWDEWAVSQTGLEYLRRAEQEGKITQGYVVLEDRWGRQVARKTLCEVLTSLEGIPPREGVMGPYWWFRSDLTPQDEPMGADDAPF
jgi:hypothetical protein